MINVGDEVTCTAGAFDARVEVFFQINPLLGTAITDDEGIATLVARIPDGCAFANGRAAGTQTVTASGIIEGQAATASAMVTITDRSGTCASRLPTTGFDSERLIGIALALIAVGGLVILRARHEGVQPYPSRVGLARGRFLRSSYSCTIVAAP